VLLVGRARFELATNGLEDLRIKFYDIGGWSPDDLIINVNSREKWQVFLSLFRVVLLIS
jgi:hypothetical protein